jgi:hypothetical protein
MLTVDQGWRRASHTSSGPSAKATKLDSRNTGTA